MRRKQCPRRFDRPGMQRALADPVNRVPVRFEEIRRDTLFDPDERQHIDRTQARELRKLLTGTLEYEILEGSHTYEEPDEEEADDA